MNLVHILPFMPLILIFTLKVNAGDLVQGLQSTNTFLTGTLVPVITVLGFIFAGLTFYFGQGSEATKKSMFIGIGSVLIYTSNWFVDQLQMFFGR